MKSTTITRRIGQYAFFAAASTLLTCAVQAQTLGSNLAVTGPSAGADGSGFDNTKLVRDGSTATVTVASGTSNQRVSVKWGSAVTFNTVILRESGSKVTTWSLVDNDTGTVLATGTGIGAQRVVNIASRSTKKINLIVNATSAPGIAEFEVYNATGTASSAPASSVAPSSVPASSKPASSSSRSSVAPSSTPVSSSRSSVAPSSRPASSLAASSAPSSYNGAIRPAKIEGFAAHANVTGGAGGSVVTVSTGTQLNAALCGRSTMSEPIVIRVNGTIRHSNTTAQGCNTLADTIEIKQMSNISIIGVGTNALFDEMGIHVRDSSNIIIQNVHIRNVKKSGSPTSNGGDAIGMETNVNRVWIDHNKLEASGGEKDGYDSLLDMKAGVTNVTVSYNVFNDSSRAGLIGSSDSDNKNTNITFHHNWYKNIEQRTPLIRHALVHIYNNYWSNDSLDYMFHAINSRMNAKALVESNYFYNVNNPLIASDDSDVAGCWQTNNENTVLPSIYYSRIVGNGALVIPQVVNGQLQSTCSVNVPYSVVMDRSVDVPAVVMANAGVGKIAP